MESERGATVAALPDVKPVGAEHEASQALRRQIASGMKWTLWLSLLTGPLGYATTILLARCGPAVIGAYGLVSLYVALSSCLFYFGGDAVLIRFVPGMAREQRLSFFASYYGITCLALLPWLAAALLWPGKLHYVFGHGVSPQMQVALVCLAPIYILFSLTQAGLKSVLQIREAQMLLRIITVGSFAIYGALFFFARPFLIAHYAYLVWGVYLVLAAVAALSGLVLLVKAIPASGFGFHLPQGFWRYTLATEQVSALSFFAGGLNSFLVLNYGGLEALGKFVLVFSLGDILRLGNRYISDSLMPSLTNLIARGDHAGVAELFSVIFRTLLLVNCIAATAMIAFVGPIVALVGPHYSSIADFFVIVAFAVGTAMAGTQGGTLLSSFGKQEYQIATNILQLVTSTGLFFMLWPTWHLKGAVVATSAGVLAGSLALIAAARWGTKVRFAFVKSYVALLMITAAVAGLTLRFLPLGIAAAAGTWIAAVGIFFVAAGYSVAEIKMIAGYFVPGRVLNLLRQVRAAGA